MMSLHYADYIVFGGLLLISALIGPFYMWKDRNKTTTSESYFVANRGLHIIPTAASLFASFWSAIALVGIPAELYTGGAKFFMSSVGQAIGIAIAAFVAVPVVYNMRLISSYEYFELRFKSRLLRKIGTISNVFATAFYLAVVTFAPCIALEAVSPIPLWASVIATATITMIYTVLGGIKAVVLVDLIQAAVMFGGVIVAIIIGYYKIDGGFSKAMEIAQKGGRLDFFDFNPDLTNTYNFWIMVIPPIMATAGLYATSQAAVQRYSALPTVKQAMWSVMSLAPQIIVLKLLLFFLSLAMFAHYDAQGCDPLRAGIIKSPNQLTTFYIADVLHYPGLVGLWFASLFSGSLSTMSTGYNSLAACIWEDLLKESLQHRLSERGISNVLKLISLVLGIFTCLLAICFQFLTGSVIKLTNSTVSVFGAAIYIAFFCGALFPFINTLGTIVGMICATLLILFVSGGQLYFKLGNEQVWLPSKTENCTAMVANLIASGKFKPPVTPVPLIANSTANATKAIATGLMLLTAGPAMQMSHLNATNSTSLIAPGGAAIGGEDLLLMATETPVMGEAMSSGDGSEGVLYNTNGDAPVMEIETTTGMPEKNETKAELWKILPKPLLYIFSISYFIFPFLSLVAGVLIACGISLCTGGLQKARTVNPKYMIVRNCFYKPEEDKDAREAESWYYEKRDNAAEKKPPLPSHDATGVHNILVGGAGLDDAQALAMPQPTKFHYANQAVDDDDDEDDENYANMGHARQQQQPSTMRNRAIDNPLYPKLGDPKGATMEMKPFVQPGKR